MTTLNEQIERSLKFSTGEAPVAPTVQSESLARALAITQRVVESRKQESEKPRQLVPITPVAS